ncbi:polyribonucleotide nucleotidyltransferase [Limimonas halophila]|uniref:Polyribonucleotide nucleotidyltransferase n=1 Tax=Limimonas halophila TaxID=1082479 RepID=A0A1G7SIX5_9PROT|nr:polyribonucleotide nucleotidyltransferase [Limimonas halophila]SDG23036.1 polyribonucleotide nucleotidyltransferase [Limimonas halophila]
MFDVHRKEIDWGGRPLVLETGRIARQADGAVMARYGDTVVLCTAVGDKSPKAGLDFFPLTVNYQEKTAAAGKIPGGFIKREGRPTEKETLTSRLIDRPIRPLFAKNFKNETQVICTVLSHDLENDPDMVAMVGASAALTLSGMPFMGPIGACRVGYRNGQFELNPAQSDVPSSELDLVVAGTSEGVLMVESEASELPESTMLEAVNWGHQQYQKVIDAIVELAEECANEPWSVPEDPAEKETVHAKLREQFGGRLREAYAIADKKQRQVELSTIRQEALDALADNEMELYVAPSVLKDLEREIVRGSIIESGKRIDGRSVESVRPISAEVGVLPRTHGSGLFTRGETQAMVTTTLGTGQDEQIVDALEGEYRQHFMLHYNFPPYCVGETGRMMAPGRREIGHGKLAWRALNPIMPSKESFPYTVRVLSEITESNGSSSMATVCGSSLSMMDAGVPLPRSCAGIAMGLIKEGDNYAVLSDIMGDEDHLGDMDFKVAGTREGVTSLQMDIKITSVTSEIMQVALNQAHDGRMHILGEMEKAITAAREGVSERAPSITVIEVPKEKIRDIIGPGGKVVREICEETGAKIDIEDDGTVKIAAVDKAASDAAINRIRGITAEPEAGEVYQGKVVKIMDFGAFVNFLGTRDGLVHVSQMADYRVNHPRDLVAEGDMVYVKCLGFDDRGKVKLSMKQVDQETGQEIEKSE